jgi:pimeloyl-ACP methyl ester carboxylesterase
VEVLADEFRVIAMDQRNAGQSVGPLEADDPWGMFAADQLGLLDYLGIDKYFALGCCIGCSYILHLILKAPERMLAGVMEQPIGIEEDGSNLEMFRERIWQGWGDGLLEKRADITKEVLVAFGQKMWGGDFVLNVSKDFVRGVKTPLLVMPGNDPAHPRSIGLDVARLLPNGELFENWKGEPELVARNIQRTREFLREHAPK